MRITNLPEAISVGINDEFVIETSLGYTKKVRNKYIAVSTVIVIYEDGPHIMVGDEEFLYSLGTKMIAFLDAGGSDRNFNPDYTETFPVGWELTVFNQGEELITLDNNSPGLCLSVGPGASETICWDGGDWNRR